MPRLRLPFITGRVSTGFVRLRLAGQPASAGATAPGNAVEAPATAHAATANPPARDHARRKEWWITRRGCRGLSRRIWRIVRSAQCANRVECRHTDLYEARAGFHVRNGTRIPCCSRKRD